jgi:cell division protein FtsX
MIKKIIFKNLLFYRQKTLLTVTLVSFLLFLALSSFMFTNKIKNLADAPLNSLQTEIILQKDKTNKNANEIKTSGVIEPFNLNSFSKKATLQKISGIKEIKNFSSALVLWQFDIQNNRTIVGLDVNDPLVGLRKIEQWLMPSSKFFSDDKADEVILERHFAKLFGYKLNSVYLIGDKNYKIVGIVDFKEESNLSNAQVFMPYNTALSLLGAEKPIINQVYISLDNASLLPKAQKEIESLLPDFSVITKDRLLKNLSSFNRLVYQFGNYFSLGIGFLSLVLISWILKMSRLEFKEQTKILKIIGWSKQKIRQWIFLESGAIIVFSLILSALFLAVFYWAILPKIDIGVLMNQNFKL